MRVLGGRGKRQSTGPYLRKCWACGKKRPIDYILPSGACVFCVNERDVAKMHHPSSRA